MFGHIKSFGLFSQCLNKVFSSIPAALNKWSQAEKVLFL